MESSTIKYIIAGRVAGGGGSFDEHLIRFKLNDTPADQRIKAAILETPDLRAHPGLSNPQEFTIRSGVFFQEIRNILNSRNKRAIKQTVADDQFPQSTLDEPAFLYGYLTSYPAPGFIKSSPLSLQVLNSLRSEIRWAEYETTTSGIELKNRRRVLQELDPLSNTN